MGVTTTSSGDLGDLVALMCCLKHVPNGPHRLLLREDGMTKGITKRIHLIKPLLESQPYISSCEVWNGTDKIDWASEQFRNGFHSTSYSLVRAHERHGNSVRAVRTPVSTRSPWLTVTPSLETRGRRILVRSPRYHNHHFPHQKIHELYGDSLLFLGLPDEHKAYEEAFGTIEYRPTENLLEAAELIAGSQLLISNQTAMLWIGHALAHPRLVEVSTATCDSVILSGSVQYCIDGEIIVPASSGMQSCALMQAFKVKRGQKILLCNTAGAMGFEPMAIGAALATGQRVVCVARGNLALRGN